MTTDPLLERRIADYLAAEATWRAPERLLESVVIGVGELTQRRSPADRLRRAWTGTTMRRRLALVLVLLMALAGVVVGGAALLRRDAPTIAPSSLVIIERPTRALDPSEPVSVIAIEPDGRRTTLATLTSDRLGAVYSEWWATLSPDGFLAVPISLDGGSMAAVVDLRAPEARAQIPDAEGAFPVFGPDGALAMSTNTGEIAVFDPSAGTTSLTPPSGAMPLQSGFSVVWAAAGDGFIARAGGLGTLRRDGRYVPGTPAAYFDGRGARRVDAGGRWLLCDTLFEFGCDADDMTLYVSAADASRFSPIWVERDPDLRVADFAWGVDGGIWVLLESAADGPRQLTLRKIGADGSETTVAALAAVPDSSDPSSDFVAGTIAAMPPDDGRVIIRASGPDGAPGELWQVDPPSGSVSRLPDGMVAGWLTSATLSSPRPRIERAAETDPAIRGVWHGDSTTLVVGRTSLSFVGDSTSPNAIVSRLDEDAIEIRGGAVGDACGNAVPGAYRWSLERDTLTLTASDEPCPDREGVIAGTFRRALPYPDTGTPTLPAGASFVVPDFLIPFEFSVPASADALAAAHREAAVTIRLGTTDADVVSVELAVPWGRVSDPCDRSSPGVALGPGVAGIADYVLSLGPPIRATELPPSSVGGVPARAFAIDVSASDAGGCGHSLFALPSETLGRGHAGAVAPRATLYVFEPPGGPVVVATVRVTEATTVRAEAWALELLESIRFAPAP